MAEIPEEEICNPKLRWNVYFQSEENQWGFYYSDGKPEGRVQLESDGDRDSVGICVGPGEERPDVSYPVLDRMYHDRYDSGKLSEHEVTCFPYGQDDCFSVTNVK